MTLGDLIRRHRETLADEAVGIRRSWEDMFRYALRHYPDRTPIDDFDPDGLADKLIAEGVNPAFVAGYVKRWRALLADIIDQP
ncbi:MAG: hypothetical protein PW791_11310 [Neorhizobium sp.]|nr:hypothetical protein [Neorhizobium sp.]